MDVSLRLINIALKSVFITRCISGIVYVLLMVFANLFHPAGAFIFYFLLACCSFYELHRLLVKIWPFLSISRLDTLVFCCLYGICFLDVYIHHGFKLGSMASLILYLMLVFYKSFFSKHFLTHTVILIASHIYTLIPFILVSDLLIQNFNQNKNLIAFALLTIWSTDSFAYVCGSLFGKHKMAPSISPGKTWEGTLGALVLTLFGVALLNPNWLSDAWYPYRMYLAIFICMASVAGDLVESKLKRMAQVKDSGNIMPGHGGVLDRMDSFIAVIPILWFVSKLWF